MVSFKGVHCVRDIILTCVRWYLAYPLSSRQVEELMEERGMSVDHATINRWVLKSSPLLEETFHRRKRPGGRSWRMDETYIRVKGQWRYIYRAVDKSGQTIDFLLTEYRDTEAARRFLTQALHRHGVLDKITIDGRQASEAAIKRTMRRTAPRSKSTRSSISTTWWNRTTAVSSGSPAPCSSVRRRAFPHLAIAVDCFYIKYAGL
jgi:putative transposase